MYGAVNMEEVINCKDYLDEEKKKKSEEVLDKHKVLSDGFLGRYPHKKFKIKMEEGTELKCNRPFPIPY